MTNPKESKLDRLTKFLEPYEKHIIALVVVLPLFSCLWVPSLIVLNTLGQQDISFNTFFTFGLLGLSIVISFVWVFEYVPHRIATVIHRGGPIAFMIIIIGVLSFISLNTYNVMITYLSDMGIDYSESLVLSVTITEFFSLAVLTKALLTRKSRQQSHRSSEPDMHTVVSIKLGINTRELFQSRRHAKTSSWHFTEYNHTSTELQIEIWGSLMISLFALIIHTRLMILSSIIEEEPFSLVVVLIAFIILTPAIPRFFSALYGFRNWRRLWKMYWTLVRQLMLDYARIPDELDVIGFPLLAAMLQLESPENYVFEAERHAERYNIPFENKKDFELIAYINWYHRTYQKADAIRQSTYDAFPTLNTIKNRVNSLKGKTYPRKDFIELIRASFLLEGVLLAEKWPALFKTLVDYFELDIMSVNKTERAEILKISTEQYEKIIELNPTPLSGSLKFISAFFVVAITLIPYFISFIYVILG